ncbi:MAG: galactose-1-phosphate uridylyltransferase [Candidatus Margulisiibacteriota bacterium]
MPEFRYNSAIDDWIIIATERAKRPEDFSTNKSYAASGDSSANCPFCGGREAKTPAETFAIRGPGTAPNTAGWQVRVIPNAFPALKADDEPKKSNDPAGFMKMGGFGIHEVIIESPAHDKIIANMDLSHVEKIFAAYRQRYISLSEDPRVKSIILFKNHGHNAGTSLSHPHSQIIALPVVPSIIKSRMGTAKDYFDEHKSCVYCDMIRMEKTEKQRIISETDNFIAFVPYAARFPFETWVLPKDHASNFKTITEKQCTELAGISKTALEKLFRGVNNPDFNFAIYSAPCQETKTDPFHWNLKIFPRITTAAGFELGSGIIINTMVPETAAKHLQEV